MVAGGETESEGESGGTQQYDANETSLSPSGVAREDEHLRQSIPPAHLTSSMLWYLHRRDTNPIGLCMAILEV